VTAAVFGETMKALAPLGLSVSALGLPMGALTGFFTASFATIRLPAIAAAADTKANVTEMACNANQKHDLRPCQTPEAALLLEKLQRLSVLYRRLSQKARNDPFGLFPYFNLK
jgi:hypothetical protein